MVNPYHNSPVTTASSRRSCVFTACWRWSRQRRYSKTDEQFDVNKSDEDDAILRITTAICRWVWVNSRVRRRANLSSYAENNIPVSSVVTAVHHQPKQHAPSRQQYIPSMYPRDQATAATTSKEMRVGKLSSRVRIAKLRRAAVSVRPSVHPLWYCVQMATHIDIFHHCHSSFLKTIRRCETPTGLRGSFSTVR